MTHMIDSQEAPPKPTDFLASFIAIKSGHTKKTTTTASTREPQLNALFRAMGMSIIEIHSQWYMVHFGHQLTRDYYFNRYFKSINDVKDNSRVPVGELLSCYTTHPISRKTKEFMGVCNSDKFLAFMVSVENLVEGQGGIGAIDLNPTKVANSVLV
jgi:hypothetical protein